MQQMLYCRKYLLSLVNNVHFVMTEHMLWTCLFTRRAFCLFLFFVDKMMETFISKVVKQRVMFTFVYLSVRACVCVCVGGWVGEGGGVLLDFCVCWGELGRGGGRCYLISVCVGGEGSYLISGWFQVTLFLHGL